MRFVVIQLADTVGSQTVVPVSESMTLADVVARLSGSVPASPLPSPGSPPSPYIDRWWYRSVQDRAWADWVVATVAVRFSVSAEAPDVDHLIEKAAEADRAAYIDYLEVQYRLRGEG